MGLKSDRWIRRMAREARLIEPFEEKLVRRGVISYGLSSYGYDLRLSPTLYLLGETDEGIIDPKAFDEAAMLRRLEGETFLIPPHGYALGLVLEYLCLPRNVVGLVWGKSTYTRAGLMVNLTPLEPGWEGHLTLSMANQTARPLRLYAGEGIAQVLFWEGDEAPFLSYAERRGKYQGRRDIAPPTIEEVS